MSALEVIGVKEQLELIRHEQVIERGMKTFVEVGSALLAIRESRLYRASHATFEDYCKERWGMALSTAYQLIGASEVVENVRNCGHDTLPANESQARPLTKLPPEEQADAWKEVVEASEGKPTARVVAEVVQRRLGPEPKADPVSKSPLVQHSAETDEWYTPQRYLDAAREVLGGIELDPASSETANLRVQAERFYTASHDGLAMPWGARSLWSNPPYSDNAKWVPRWHKAVESGEVQAAILLVFANTDTAWFQGLWDHWLCFTDHRIRHERPDGSTGDSPPKGSVFAYAGPRPDAFREHFSQFGQIVPPARGQ
jgi:phage N-6-adenine-methyltransferase